MPELPVPADHHTDDPLDRYRGTIGKKQTPVDRRVFWASEDREFAGLRQPGQRKGGLRKSEVRARRRFLRLVHQRGLKPEDALSRVLGIDDGPLPELQTREEFDAFWTVAFLKQVAERWLSSCLTQRCAAPPVTTARTMIEDAAADMAAVMITTARNPKAKDTDRWRAAHKALEIAGVKAPAGNALTVSPIKITGKETAAELEDMLLQVAHREPDVNRARLLTETIRAQLRALMPEKWGDKLELNGNAPIGVLGILAEMKAAKEAALSAPRITPAIEVRAEVVTPGDDHE